MSENEKLSEVLDDPEPRWPAVIGTSAVGLLYLALPLSLSVGPRWLVALLVFGLIAVSIWSHHVGKFFWNHLAGHVLSGVLTLFMIWSLVLLVLALPAHKETPVRMLESAASLWISNVLVFALWYWRLDGGGPNVRDKRIGHEIGAFLFPQMTREGQESYGPTADGDEQWSPQFVDYLFLAFNTSAAFSPTDTPVLSRWAKMLTMIQSVISLAVVVLLAARAVNIL